MVVIIFAIELQPGEEEGMTEEVLQKVKSGPIYCVLCRGCE